ncbi:hypothetical protein BC936DRAFT_142721 [Jimgerdemannia flammicorona]|uniref:Uncharacterized protein n=1 Tax=Jimgerdemannia flammicorona TaxID=994334 RepID=A0A432ZZZ1_9FUNG|nr:hypothetical protein BC936DRAFT_142721 [Jimgerdemannia flammicorona]
MSDIDPSFLFYLALATRDWKQLLAVERAEREEVLRRRAVNRERFGPIGEEDGNSVGEEGGVVTIKAEGRTLNTKPKRKRRKEPSPSVTARNMPEEARLKMASQTSLKLAGVKQKNWMNWPGGRGRCS